MDEREQGPSAATVMNCVAVTSDTIIIRSSANKPLGGFLKPQSPNFNPEAVNPSLALNSGLGVYYSIVVSALQRKRITNYSDPCNAKH